jgi:two-component system alkaline phosphatase synthesis response regulator PhoP
MKKNEYRVLVIDSDAERIENILGLLDGEGFKITKSLNPSEALVLAKKIFPHLVLLELAMAYADGTEVCIELKRDPLLSHILVVFFTSRDDDYSQIASFSAGADDYIIKPQKKKVFISRINALLKRKSNGSNFVPPLDLSNTLDSKIIIDKESYLVIKEGEKIMLPRKEFELLAFLASAPKKVFSRKEISDCIWKCTIPPENRTIDVHIRRLRRKIGEEYITTIKGFGYKLNVSVSVLN